MGADLEPVFEPEPLDAAVGQLAEGGVGLVNEHRHVNAGLLGRPRHVSRPRLQQARIQAQTQSLVFTEKLTATLHDARISQMFNYK